MVKVLACYEVFRRRLREGALGPATGRETQPRRADAADVFGGANRDGDDDYFDCIHASRVTTQMLTKMMNPFR
jgi:hypothetical protein